MTFAQLQCAPCRFVCAWQMFADRVQRRQSVKRAGFQAGSMFREMVSHGVLLPLQQLRED